MQQGATKVFVGMSGGVDSSLTAHLLKEQGYDVTGVYMKNWTKDLPGFDCPWAEDYQDAKRVAVSLGIDFVVYDFQDQYKQKVVDYMIDSFKIGLTPNPDIMCNQEIKFRLFLDTAVSGGADMIATGHYARTSGGRLYKAANADKDQTYFLYRVTREALDKTLFPLGDFVSKEEVRAEARKRGIVTADKKDSQGICFVGKVGIREFLKQYIDEEPGPIIDQNGVEIGQHSGAVFYTIGQRQGLNIGGGLPFYVTGKDIGQNIVYVSSDLQSEGLWTDKIKLTSLHFIGDQPVSSDELQVRTRHRAPLVNVQGINYLDNGDVQLTLTEEIRANTPGQSAVIYRADECLGGGIVT